MAKGQKRGNRETKKPKQDKPKGSVAASPFAPQSGKAGAPARPPGAKK